MLREEEGVLGFVCGEKMARKFVMKENKVWCLHALKYKVGSYNF